MDRYKTFRIRCDGGGGRVSTREHVADGPLSSGSREVLHFVERTEIIAALNLPSYLPLFVLHSLSLSVVLSVSSLWLPSFSLSLSLSLSRCIYTDCLTRLAPCFVLLFFPFSSLSPSPRSISYSCRSRRDEHATNHQPRSMLVYRLFCDLSPLPV